MNQIKMFSLLIAAVFISFNVVSQSRIEKSYIDGLVKKIGKEYLDKYTFPEKGIKVNNKLLDNLAGGKYYNATNYDSLAAYLKRDVYLETQDKHVQFIYKKPSKGGDNEVSQPSPGDFFKSMDNYGFTKIELKEGNIGYVDIPVFFPIQMDAKAKDAVDAMMKKFASCKNIIFDLRGCRGGDPNMISYLISYLYPAGQKVHLNDFYYRPNGTTMSTYTQDVNGNTLPDVDVYVLTSNKTFSAGEEFSYDIKHLERGLVIGEVTGGAAHVVEPTLIDDKFDIMLPTGRAINPITKTNWEGIGVIPNVEVDATIALEKTMEVIKQKESNKKMK